MALSLTAKIASYCQDVSDYCDNKGSEQPSSSKVKNIFNWEAFQKEIGKQNLNKNEFNIIKGKVNNTLKKIQNAENKLLGKGVYEVRPDDEDFLANLKTAHRNIFKLHDNFDHDEMQDFSGKIKGEIDETISEKSNTLNKQSKRERMFRNLRRGAFLSGLAIATVGFLATVLLAIITFSTGGLIIIPFIVGMVGLVISGLTDNYYTQKESELIKKNNEIKTQIEDLLKFKKLLTPNAMRLIFDCPKIGKDHREKYIEVLFELDKLCRQWNQEITPKPTKTSMKERLELIYDKPNDNPMIKKWRYNFEHMQSDIKKCFVEKGIRDCLTDLKNLKINF